MVAAGSKYITHAVFCFTRLISLHMGYLLQVCFHMKFVIYFAQMCIEFN